MWQITPQANTDWYVDIRRTAGDLADGVTLEASNDKIQMKDGGTSTNKLAALAVTEPKMADDSVATRAIVDRNVTGAKIALATILGENHANDTIPESKLVTQTQSTLVDARAVTATEIPNMEAMIGGGINFATDSALAADTNVLTATTQVGKNQQADTELKRIVDDSALRVATIDYTSSSVNIGDPIPSGNYLIRGELRTVTQGAHSIDSIAGLTLQIGTAGTPDKYASAAVFDLFDPAESVHPFSILKQVASQEQLVATLTDNGTGGTAGQWMIFIHQSH